MKPEYSRAFEWVLSQTPWWDLIDELGGGTATTVPCSCDSFSDLLSHVVGLGKKEFSKVMKNPLLAYNRSMAKYGTKEGYEESFLYAIPYHTDYPKKVGTDE